MEALKTHKNKILSAAACVLVYALVFFAVNAERLASPDAAPQPSRLSQVPIDHEALADQEYYADYFNSDMVNRAMSLDEPLPYNAHAASAPANI